MDLPGQGLGVTDQRQIGDKKYNTDDLLALALEPVTINTSPLPDYDLDRLDYALSEGIACTPAGTLWSCWVAGGDNDKAFVVMASSDDNGQTWSKPRVVIDPHLPGLPIGRRALVANLWIDPKGKLWVFFDQALGYFDGRAGIWAAVCYNPDDSILKWSVPKRIGDGAALNKPIVTHDGAWLLPTSLWPRRFINSLFTDKFKELDSLRGANVLVSLDEGKTWALRSRPVKVPNPTVDEGMLIERKDGSLWMTIRTLDGMWESVSTDKGYNWSNPTESPISNANSRHFITRLKSGKILLVKHGQEINERPPGERTLVLGRTHLTAFLSDDDGHTWSKGLLLVKGAGSYPDGFQTRDGTIYLCYDHDRWFSAEIWMARFREEDILAGEFITPEAKNAILISRAQGLTDEERAIRVEHRKKKAKQLKNKD